MGESTNTSNPRPGVRAQNRLGPVRLDSSRLGSSGLGLARLGSARPGPSRLLSARPGPARLDSPRLGASRLVPARRGSDRQLKNNISIFVVILSTLVFFARQSPKNNKKQRTS